ncbi:HET-domain-containing protein [Coniochaeta sp. PMI_546]|nr:HET-domain-containing protein [Coniochaeta sp. PMI_546]
MRLIDTQNLRLEEFLGVDPPPYAILSHTWDVEEVTFGDMINGASYSVRAKKGFRKIEQTCRIALEGNLRYAWVDTCCIDKSSSAELTEAINSMFQYYERAQICYAYLSDLPPGVAEDVAFPKCRWFTRGWTLQELLAPSSLDFFDATWERRRSKNDAAHIICQVTGIDSDYLWYPGRIHHASVAERMSWASSRTTTRVEDLAYCLLGLFDINMPMLYGEGQKAFLRLQEEIVKRTNDLSLLAWKQQSTTESEHGCGVLAPAPSAFQASGHLLYGSRQDEFSVTNKGIKITAQLHTAMASNSLPFYILHLADDKDFAPVYLVLLKLDRDLYIRDSRINGGLWDQALQFEGPPLRTQSMYLAHDPSRRYGSETIYKKRRGSIELYIPRDTGRIKVFDVIPESIWDPALSLLLDPSSSVALLLGDPKEPYGSVYLVVLKRRTMGTIYFVPASSPAIPYILSNLASLTRQDLLAFWNLEPVAFDRVEGTPPSSFIFVGKGFDAGDLQVDLRASFREVYATTPGLYGTQGTPILQLNGLRIEQTDLELGSLQQSRQS